MVVIRVAGGTNAGVKAPLLTPASPWRCSCRAGGCTGTLRPGSWRNCPYCGDRRPTAPEHPAAA